MPELRGKARLLTVMFDWDPGWIAAAAGYGLFAGPAVALIEYSGSDPITEFPKWSFGFVGAVVVAVCFLLLRRNGVRTMHWSAAASNGRAVAVLAVGGVLWALPGDWSVPTEVLGFPFDWLLLTLPFAAAASAVAPGTRRRIRVAAVAALVSVALAWPTVCGMAAAQERRQTGVAADGWFVAPVGGYRADSFQVSHPGGVAEVDYHVPGARSEDVVEPDLALVSWPAISDSPCGHFDHVTICTFDADGNWSVEVDTEQSSIAEGKVSLVQRRGSRWLAATAFTIPPEQLPEILASAHIATDHEFLAVINPF